MTGARGRERIARSRTARGGVERRLGLLLGLLVACPVAALSADDGRLLDTQPAESARLREPSEGRWSIGVGWREEWPETWHHASPSSRERVGEWTVLRGAIALPGGAMALEDAVRRRRDGLLECRRRWAWHGERPLEAVTLTVRWSVAAREARPFLPGISYFGNPAGARVDAARVPVFAMRPELGGFYEEHRYPQPFAALECEGADGALFGVALHSSPSPVQDGARADLWWSLGARRSPAEGHEVALLSGPVASNGQRGVVKGAQARFVAYPGAHARMRPGAVVEKTFWLQEYAVPARGDSMGPPIRASIRLAEPLDFGGFPDVSDVVRAKFRDTMSRWVENERCAGVDAFPGADRPWIDLGWAGQSEAVGYPLLLLGERFGISDAVERARRASEFVATAPFDDDGFAIRYDHARDRWFPRRNPLSQAQAMDNLLNALRVARRQEAFDTGRVERFLRRACDLHAARVERADWRPVSTNEAFLISPLAQAAKLLDEPRYLAAARRAGEHYLARHRSMDEPYWGGTLDARCEDKEGAWAGLQGFLALHEATGERVWLDGARHAADVVLSYVYVWNVPLPPGRLSDHAFESRGWTSVSVQNMHLDVYGVLCAPALWRLGELLDDSMLRDVARLMVVACGQLVDPRGGQGEQIQQTNYTQFFRDAPLEEQRGNYVETWTVYWISAHFLSAAARFEEMGVDWRAW